MISRQTADGQAPVRLPRLRARFGDVARHGYEIYAGALGEGPPGGSEILEEGLSQFGEVLALEATVGAEVEVGEMEDEHAVPRVLVRVSVRSQTILSWTLGGATAEVGACVASGVSSRGTL